MASIQSTTIVTNNSSVLTYSWALGAGDTGKAVNLSAFPDKTVQVTGTFGSVTLRGSNVENADDATAAHWFTLSNQVDSDITLVAAGGSVIAENPLWISPIATGGAAYVVTVAGVR